MQAVGVARGFAALPHQQHHEEVNDIIACKLLVMPYHSSSLNTNSGKWLTNNISAVVGVAGGFAALPHQQHYYEVNGTTICKLLVMPSHSSAINTNSGKQRRLSAT